MGVLAAYLRVASTSSWRPTSIWSPSTLPFHRGRLTCGTPRMRQITRGVRRGCERLRPAAKARTYMPAGWRGGGATSSEYGDGRDSPLAQQRTRSRPNRLGSTSSEYVYSGRPVTIASAAGCWPAALRPRCRLGLSGFGLARCFCCSAISASRSAFLCASCAARSRSTVAVSPFLAALEIGTSKVRSGGEWPAPHLGARKATGVKTGAARRRARLRTRAWGPSAHTRVPATRSRCPMALSCAAQSSSACTSVAHGGIQMARRECAMLVGVRGRVHVRRASR